MIYSLLGFYWNWRAYKGHPRRWEVTLNDLKILSNWDFVLKRKFKSFTRTCIHMIPTASYLWQIHCPRWRQTYLRLICNQHDLCNGRRGKDWIMWRQLATRWRLKFYSHRLQNKTLSLPVWYLSLLRRRYVSSRTEEKRLRDERKGLVWYWSDSRALSGHWACNYVTLAGSVMGGPK